MGSRQARCTMSYWFAASLHSTLFLLPQPLFNHRSSIVQVCQYVDQLQHTGHCLASCHTGPRHPILSHTVWPLLHDTLAVLGAAVRSQFKPLPEPSQQISHHPRSAYIPCSTSHCPRPSQVCCSKACRQIAQERQDEHNQCRTLQLPITTGVPSVGWRLALPNTIRVLSATGACTLVA